jgi:hypothetical protein
MKIKTTPNKSTYSRRDFLRLASLGLFSLAFRPYQSNSDFFDSGDSVDMVRVAIKQISVYSEPSEKSRILFQHYRDDLLNVYYETVSEDGPQWNPLWYRVWGGWVHRAHTQWVRMELNMPLSTVKESGQPMVVSVPFTQTFWYSQQLGWQPNWRVYYGSNHWVVGVETGPDGEAWYKIDNDIVNNVAIYAPAIHLRPISSEELCPISPDVPLEDKRIEVSIVDQEITAYEKDNIVMQTRVSSGLLHPTPSDVIPMATPKGTFNITSKMSAKHMGEGILTTDMEAYVLPGVPWTMFFETSTGVAFHGTYWHTNYGIPMSRGCVNMTYDESQWLYRWTDPKVDLNKWHTVGYGTQVIVY